MSDTTSTHALRAEAISKSFGATHALTQVSFEAEFGQALAVIGENGAGKSTLMKILSGFHAPDRGRLWLNDQPYRPTGPQNALRQGVAMIYQELNLAPDLSVEDNIMLGQERTVCGLLRRGEQRRRVKDALEVLGHGDLDLDAPVSRLPVGLQQLVEIARALVAEARIMIFDEPTSSLTQRDVERLFSVIDELKRRGVAILYISHFLEEIRRIGDRYIVLRDGECVDSGPLAGTTDRQIVSKMVGRNVDDLFPTVEHTPGDETLRVEGLSGSEKPSGVDLTLRRGEIMGIAGLVGAGRTELMRCLMGLDVCVEGTVARDEQPLPASVPGRLNAGLGLVSEDRKTEGLAQDLSILENITLSQLSRFTLGRRALPKWLGPLRWAALLSPGARRKVAEQLVDRMQIKVRNPLQTVGELSGGNQQKVALARVFAKKQMFCPSMNQLEESMSGPKPRSIV